MKDDNGSDMFGPCQTDAERREALRRFNADRAEAYAAMDRGRVLDAALLGPWKIELPSPLTPTGLAQAQRVTAPEVLGATHIRPEPPAGGVGVKHDAGKAPLALLGMVARALADVARVQEYGARKYPAPDNWKHIPDGARRYRDAALRHLFADLRGEVDDPETGLSHLAHAACNLLIAMEHDAGFEEVAVDPTPRPPPGEPLPAWRFPRRNG